VRLAGRIMWLPAEARRWPYFPAVTPAKAHRR